MVTDDEELAEIHRKCVSGEIMCGQCKKETAERVLSFLKDFRRRWTQLLIRSRYTMAELTQNEKRLLRVLEQERNADALHLATLLDTTPEAVVQWAHLAQDKGLVTVERLVAKEFVYTDEGRPMRKMVFPKHSSSALSCQGLGFLTCRNMTCSGSDLASCEKRS